MEPNTRWQLWSPRLIFAAVAAILVVVGFIQYQWFSQSAAVEIEAAIKGQESLVRQTVAREFQRYAPVVSELTALRVSGVPSKARLGAAARSLVVAYGPQGTVPGLLTWAGYSVPGEALVHRWNAGGTETTVPSDRGDAPLPPLDEPFIGTLTQNDVLQYRTGEGPAAPVFLVGVDVEAFFRGDVFTALAEVFPGATFHWDQGTGEQPPGGFDRRTYAFSPLTALVTGASLARTIEVGLPRFLDLGPRRPQDKVGLPGKVGVQDKGEAQDGSFGIVPRKLPWWTITVVLPADAPVLGVEGRLAWNWLGSTLLLAVLGVAFGLVLRQSARLAHQRRREREFVASVSHELRTPLTVIRSAADNFSRGIVAPERQGQYGLLIMDQVLRLGRMIEEMIALAQTEATNPTKVEAPLSFGPWLAELRPPLEALAASRGVTLEWDVAGVPAAGTTDPDVLRLVLENLVINAVNHAYPTTAPGPKPVRITLRYRLSGRLEVVVDDDGRGISPKEARRVFEPFYRDEVSRNTQEKGSGLGLFLAQRQIRKLGGELTLETPWRRIDGVKRPGCRFVATLPLGTIEEEAHVR